MKECVTGKEHHSCSSLGKNLGEFCLLCFPVRSDLSTGGKTEAVKALQAGVNVGSSLRTINSRVSIQRLYSSNTAIKVQGILLKCLVI